ncbi:sulfurtransferase FdhD [Notoacmeibacter marinus]|uniref:Sulfur carrier protein FdhD n=1 Tax=Notoacmeibacter marinus TaxID=1876515 RepID=A0A231V3Z7_9HYPH|nr:formate dehydrogenase accessory sulfurtransferase FdhD [Notoacmeibacter marinus]OXT02912.1 sulfurtransferase FdhD [Notoacmeibacter marinus]
MESWRSRQSMGFEAGKAVAPRRHDLPEEVAIALTCNGTTQAVMMGTPADLNDFATGFLLTEGLAQPDEIEAIEPIETEHGLDLQIRLVGDAEARLAKRRRSMAGPVGCGLCGIESLEAAMAASPSVGAIAGPAFSPEDVSRAIALLPTFQPLHDATLAVHGAAFYTPEGGIALAREDVGRHNALDKLVGALIANNCDPALGAILITSRVSIDMVQKVLRAGAPILIAVSAPTASALDLAERHGLTVVGLAKGSRFEIFTHPERIRSDDATQKAPSHAAR